MAGTLPIVVASPAWTTHPVVSRAVEGPVLTRFGASLLQPTGNLEGSPSVTSLDRRNQPQNLLAGFNNAAMSSEQNSGLGLEPGLLPVPLTSPDLNPFAGGSPSFVPGLATAPVGQPGHQSTDQPGYQFVQPSIEQMAVRAELMRQATVIASAAKRKKAEGLMALHRAISKIDVPAMFVIVQRAVTEPGQSYRKYDGLQDEGRMRWYKLRAAIKSALCNQDSGYIDDQDEFHKVFDPVHKKQSVQALSDAGVAMYTRYDVLAPASSTLYVLLLMIFTGQAMFDVEWYKQDEDGAGALHYFDTIWGVAGATPSTATLVDELALGAKIHGFKFKAGTPGYLKQFNELITMVRRFSEIKGNNPSATERLTVSYIIDASQDSELSSFHTSYISSKDTVTLSALTLSFQKFLENNKHLFKTSQQGRALAAAMDAGRNPGQVDESEVSGS